MIRRYGEPVRRGVNYVLRTGVYAVIPGASGLLVTHQLEPEPEFQLPGGGVDPGESHLAALHREVREETGWRIAAPRRLGAYRRFTYMPDYDLWAEKVCHIYCAKPVRSYGPPTEPGHAAFWLSPDAATSLLASAGDGAFVRQFFSVR